MNGLAWTALCLVLWVGNMGCSGHREPPPDIPPWKGDSLAVLKDYLVRGTDEVDHYGAYSYVLIPRDPNSDPRYVELLEAYSALPANPQECSDLGTRNITYAPVKEEPPEKQEPGWLPAHYDEQRAAAFLRMQCLSDVGPYIVTSIRVPMRLTPQQDCSGKSARRPVDLAVIDLSGTPPGSMRAWVNHFVRLSQEPDDWARRKSEEVLLRVHDSLTKLGMGFKVTFEALSPSAQLMRVLPATAD